MPKDWERRAFASLGQDGPASLCYVCIYLLISFSAKEGDGVLKLAQTGVFYTADHCFLQKGPIKY